MTQDYVNAHFKSEANLEESSKSSINSTGKVDFDEDDFDDEEEDLEDDK